MALQAHSHLRLRLHLTSSTMVTSSPLTTLALTSHSHSPIFNPLPLTLTFQPIRFSPLPDTHSCHRRRRRNIPVTTVVEESQESSEPEAEAVSEPDEQQQQQQQPQAVAESELATKLKKAMQERKEKEGEDFLGGVAQEIREIEWPPFGKVLGTTGVVLSVIFGSGVVLLTVNAVLAELSDRVFAGRGVQDFFG